MFMGLQIGDIVPRKAIELGELKGKIIAVDAFNILYQFLSTIRQPDGTPLMDKKGRVTSHLSGLFYRNINLLLGGIRLVYVFDGKPPKLKGKTHEKREEIKKVAKEKYEKAKQKEDIESMGKYARQFARLDEEKIQESKDLLRAMGIAIVQAPGEGEAQAAWLCKNNEEIYAVASQDYDALLFGTQRLIQNLTLARKRKISSGSYVYISPELIELHRVLNSLQITQDQLISLGILAGTDYNPAGIRGIGQKKALKIVQQFKQPTLIFGAMQEQIQSQEQGFDWQKIFELFHKPDIDKNAKMQFPKFDEEKIKKLLLEHDFSEQRIDNQLDKIQDAREKAKQKTLFELI